MRSRARWGGEARGREALGREAQSPALRRAAAGLVLACLLAAGAVGPAHAQVLIDDFSEAQAQLQLQDPPDSPGDTDGSSQAGAGMIGGTRDLFLTWIAGGTGPVSTEVTGGSLLFDTAADSDARVLVTWDADSDPNNLDAGGLGNADLTAGGTQSTLRFTVDSADAGLELVLTVYTNATDFSTSAQVLPSVGAATDFFFPFGGFVADPGGSGADFTDVGAISLLVRGSGVNAGSALSFSAGNLDTAAPTIVALQADQPGTPAAPGDTITFEATVQNTGGQGEGVTFNETLDANVTIVPGSVKTSPLARNDAFSGVGNVDITVAAPGVLGNDVDLDDLGPSSLVVTTTGAIPTAQGGTATLAADGSFTYAPPPGFQGVDGFSYSVADDEAETDSAAVVITLDAIVWFVENDACSPHPCGSGTFADPFSSLKQAETASSAGHFIRLREGDGTTLNNDQGLIKKDGQHLIGSGVDLVVGGQTIETATSRPVMTHVAGNGIDLASENTIRGLNIAGSSGAALFGTGVGTVTVDEVDVTDSGGAALDVDGGTLAMTFGTLDSLSSSGHGIHLRNVGGSLTATTTNLDDPTDTGIRVATSAGASFDFGATTITNAGDAGGADAGIDLASSGAATFTFSSLSSTTENGAGLVGNGSGTVNIGGSTNTITATGGPALDVTNTDLGTGWTFSSLTSSTSPTEGIRLDTISDPITVDSATVVQNPDTTGILVQGSASTAFDFGPTTVTDTMVGAGNTANGIDLLTGNTGASFTFDSLSVTTDGGFGLRSGASTLNVGGSTNSLTANGGAALDLTGTTLNAGTFTTLTSAGSPGKGINLDTVTGGFTATGGSITNATGNAFDVAGGSGNVTYAGSITNTAARSVEVSGRSGDAIVLSGNVNDTGTGISLSGNTGGSTTLSGSSKIVNTGAGNAVTISGSSGHSLAFTNGGLDVDTTSGNGIDVSGGIDLDVSGGTNTINSTTGIGFQADGGGTLNVTGNAAVTAGTGSGVDIQNTNIGASGATFLRVSSSGGASPGIRLNSTGTITGSFFSVTGSGGDCKGNAANCSGGTISAKTGVGVDVDAARDVRLAAMQIDGSGSHGIALDNVAGFTFDNSRLTNHGDAAGEQGLRGRELSGAVNLTNSHFQGNVEDHVEVLNDTNATTSTVTVTGNLFAINNASSPGNNAINYASRGTVSKNITFDIRGNTFQDIRATAIQIDAERNTTHNITIGGPNAGDVNTFTSNNVALNLTNNFSGDVVALIENNDMTGHGSSGAGQVINLFTATSATAGSTFHATVRNNRIGTMGVSNSGTPNGNAVRVISQGNTAMRVLIEENVVHGVTNGGIDAQARDGVASLDLTLSDNDLNFEDSIGVFVAATATAGETLNLCADIGGPGSPGLEPNTIVNEELTAFFVFAGVTVQQSASGGGAATFTLPNFGGGGTAAVESFIDGQNVISTPGAMSAQNVFATGTFTAGGSACLVP